MSAIFAQRLMGPMASLDITCTRDVKVSIQGTGSSCPGVCSSVWNAQSILLQDEPEKVQKRVARIITGNYTYEAGSVTGILNNLSRNL